MTQEIVVKGEKIVLETDVYYSGDSGISDEEKGIRRALKLPVTKQLIYYRNAHDATSKVPVSKFRIVEMYNITFPWFTLEINLADDDSDIKIHSMFFSEMQKPSFVEDLKKQEQADLGE